MEILPLSVLWAFLLGDLDPGMLSGVVSSLLDNLDLDGVRSLDGYLDALVGLFLGELSGLSCTGYILGI